MNLTTGANRLPLDSLYWIKSSSFLFTISCALGHFTTSKRHDWRCRGWVRPIISTHLVLLHHSCIKLIKRGGHHDWVDRHSPQAVWMNETIEFRRCHINQLHLVEANGISCVTQTLWAQNLLSCSLSFLCRSLRTNLLYYFLVHQSETYTSYWPCTLGYHLPVLACLSASQWTGEASRSVYSWLDDIRFLVQL